MPPEDNLIKIQIDKEITSLFKFFLEEAEKLEKDPEKYLELRKKILSHGNDTIRQLTEFLSYFDFQINNQKLEEVLKQRITHKKIIINSLIAIE